MSNPGSRRLVVILVNYRSLAAIRRLFETGVLDAHRVVVVDNGDDPAGVGEVCTTYGAEALLLERNVGFAAAVNRAVAHAGFSNEPWLLLNPDISITASQLLSLHERFDIGDVDGVAPALLLPDGSLQVGAAGGPLTLRSVIIYFLFLSHIVPTARGIFFTRRQTRRIERADWLCMACVLLAADAFARFGPIPEDELVYAEDVAWGTLASSRGAQFRLVPSIVVSHESGASGGNAAWDGALRRLCMRRLGRVRGCIAGCVIWVGLATRRIVRHVLERR